MLTIAQSGFPKDTYQILKLIEKMSVFWKETPKLVCIFKYLYLILNNTSLSVMNPSNEGGNKPPSKIKKTQNPLLACPQTIEVSEDVTMRPFSPDSASLNQKNPPKLEVRQGAPLTFSSQKGAVMQNLENPQIVEVSDDVTIRPSSPDSALLNQKNPHKNGVRQGAPLTFFSQKGVVMQNLENPQVTEVNDAILQHCCQSGILLNLRNPLIEVSRGSTLAFPFHESSLLLNQYQPKSNQNKLNKKNKKDSIGIAKTHTKIIKSKNEKIEKDSIRITKTHEKNIKSKKEKIEKDSIRITKTHEKNIKLKKEKVKKDSIGITKIHEKIMKSKKLNYSTAKQILNIDEKFEKSEKSETKGKQYITKGNIKTSKNIKVDKNIHKLNPQKNIKIQKPHILKIKIKNVNERKTKNKKIVECFKCKNEEKKCVCNEIEKIDNCLGDLRCACLVPVNVNARVSTTYMKHQIIVSSSDTKLFMQQRD